MPQNLNQNGHTFWSMWTLQSHWPSEKPHFLVMMVFNKWQNGILVALIINGKSRESDLDPILQTLSKCIPSSWMPKVILVDNVQAKINVLKFDFIKFTYISIYNHYVL